MSAPVTASAPLNILFITARFPYPVLKGDQVRAYHQLRLLGTRHRITLLSFAEEPPSRKERAHVQALCNEVVIVPITRLDMAGALVKNLLLPLPLQTMLYQTTAMDEAVRRQLDRGFDVVHVQLARMAEHVVGSGTPCVVDLIDALSLNMDRRATEQRGMMGMIAAHEADRMRRYERRLCSSVEEVSVVSPVDRDVIGSYENLHVNGNGVDVEHFSFSRENRDPHTLVFSGNMGYFPNVNAVLWFAREVLPRIKAEIPSVTLEVVGTSPTRDVRALAEDNPAISVTGFVDDVRVALRRASVGVVPMRAGTGMQNKVVEAMSCGTPLVATPFALGGIEAVDGRHLLVAQDAASFAAQTIRLLRDAPLRDAIARNARMLVECSHSWEASTSALEKMYERAYAQNRFISKSRARSMR